jgi:hypothetical protein
MRLPFGRRSSSIVPLVPREPRAWNLWELHRITSEQGETRGELGVLLVLLRQFANADGSLPKSFDPLVREAFGDVLARAA